MLFGHRVMTASSVSRNRERQGRESFAGTPRLGRLHQWWTSPLYQEGPLSSANDVSRDPDARSHGHAPESVKPIARMQAELEHLRIVVIADMPAHRQGRADGDGARFCCVSLTFTGTCSTPTGTRSPMRSCVGCGTDVGRVCGERSSDARIAVVACASLLRGWNSNPQPTDQQSMHARPERCQLAQLVP
jgi:hypothetical protein